MIAVQFILGTYVLIGIRHTWQVGTALKQTKAREARAAELHEAQRKQLDDSIQWAYMRGVNDGIQAARTDQFDRDTQLKIVVADFRLQYGEELREVAS